MRLLITILFLFSTHFVVGQVNRFNCSKVTGVIKITADSVLDEDSHIGKNENIGYIKDSKADFEIRYYYNPGLVTGGTVTIANCIDDKMQAKRINYWFSVKKDYNKRKIKKVETIELAPKSWEIFLDSLQSMNFYNFPTMTAIRPKMKKFVTRPDGRVVEQRFAITDGAYYTFEVKIGNDIRAFKYHSPEAWYELYNNVDELRQARQIIDYFQTNLNEVSNH